MKNPAIVQLLASLETRYGKKVTPYGTSEKEETGTGFRVEGIEATFSAILLPDTPTGYYDIQIESYPPGAYIYQDEVMLGDFLDMIEEYRREASSWRPEKWKQK
jgi:hypothetical protein